MFIVLNTKMLLNQTKKYKVDWHMKLKCKERKRPVM